jgi:transposase-like protein
MTCDLTNPIFFDEARATAHMEADRWPDGVSCPLCGVDNVTKMGGQTQAGMFMCNGCRGKFTVRTGTVFERSHIPLHKWLMATHLMAASKKGMSAKQLSRMLGITYKSAWFMCHRIRAAMNPAKPVGPIGGHGKVVEVDETFIGGKKEEHRKEPKKVPVLTLVERDGMSYSYRLANVTAKTLRPILVKIVSTDSHLSTDNAGQYRALGKEFAEHGAVSHSTGEYVRDIWHTNTAESRFALMKRAVYGTHRSVSEAHLHRYLVEWDFKWNTRQVTDKERAALALKGAKGKRLTYQNPDRAAYHQTNS